MASEYAWRLDLLAVRIASFQPSRGGEQARADRAYRRGLMESYILMQGGDPSSFDEGEVLAECRMIAGVMPNLTGREGE